LNLPSDIKRESFDSFSRLDYVINPEHRLTVSFSLFPQKVDYFNLNTFNPIETTANGHQRGWFLALNEQATFKSGSLLQSSFSVKEYDGDIFGNSAAPYRIAPGRNFAGTIASIVTAAVMNCWKSHNAARSLARHILRGRGHQPSTPRVFRYGHEPPVTILRRDASGIS
jgi:hypothetical protein